MTKHVNQIQHFRISPSKQIEMIADALHCVAIFACWLSHLPWVSQVVLTCVVLVFWRLTKTRWKARSIHLSYTETIGWQVSSDGDNYLNAVILETTVITNVVIFLHYRKENQAFNSVAIARDSLSSDDFRCLKVRLTLTVRGRE